ncbi:MAG TPA: NmrA/HSCARG family protein [Nitrospirota bacterium]|nr:NmrA/HSCARG family protein [Nitrospirota bacterium]
MDKSKDKILVTGATGRQGGAVARYLLKSGYKVVVMTRKPQDEKAGMLRSLGAEVIQGDYDAPKSCDPALEGIWGVFAVQNTWEAGVEREEEQGKRFAELARKKGVIHYVYASVGSAHRNTGIPHFDNKWRIEETVRGLKFPSYTILRPAFFMENFTSPSFLPGLLEGKLLMGLKAETKLQMIAADDIGRFGFLAFDQHEKMNGVELDIAGDEHTMPETAEILGRAMGRSIRFVEVPKEEVRKMSEDYAIMLEWFDRVGYNVDIAALAQKYGIKPIKLSEWAARVNWLARKAA